MSNIGLDKFHRKCVYQMQFELRNIKIAFGCNGYLSTEYNELKNYKSAIFVGIEVKISGEAQMYSLYHFYSFFV